MIKTDYTVYTLSFVEKAVCVIAGGMLGCIVGYIFYENIAVALLSAAACAFAAIIFYRRSRVESRKRRLLLQFRDLLESLSVSLGAGSNINSAFLSAEEDMAAQHGGDSLIARELKIINAGIAGNENIEQLLSDLGERSGIGDIKSFSSVFETCFRMGGSIKEVVNMSCRVICEKIDTRQEIRTMVSAKKSEQNAMLVMPVIFVLLLKGAGAGVIDLTSPSGTVSTTVAVFLFAAAYFIGKRILKIEL